MKVGLFFGTFNPIHCGHISISNQILSNTNVEKVWMIISPQSPNKEKNKILEKKLRFKMMNRALKKYNNIMPSKVEFDMDIPNYTYKTLIKLVNEYPQNEFVIIMGEDNYLSLETWIKSNYIKNNFEIIVYPRNKNSIDKLFFDGELLDISSKQIRERIKSVKKVSGMVPVEVEKEIIKNGYYIR